MGGGETGFMYVHDPNRPELWLYIDRVSYLYERSTYRYVRLNALNVLQVNGPLFNAPDHCVLSMVLDLVGRMKDERGGGVFD